MSRPEILAPAGNREMLGAAVFSGADAVYLGLTGFNARRTAGNFTPDELREAVAFCHARGVKVHVTLCQFCLLYTSRCTFSWSAYLKFVDGTRAYQILVLNHEGLVTAAVLLPTG